MHKKGFTLLELIISIVIISLLTAIGSIGYTDIIQNARNAKRKSDLRELQLAIEKYYQDQGAYPDTSGQPICSFDHPTDYIPDLVSDGYIQKLPQDPTVGRKNQSIGICSMAGVTTACYMYTSNGINYKLSAYCTPEGTLDTNDVFYDSIYPGLWSVYTRGAFAW